MQKLLYTAQDIAAIMNSQKLSLNEETKLLNQIWKYDRAFLSQEYRDNKRKLILDMYYWGNYFHDKLVIDAEFPSIRNDFATRDNDLKAEDYIVDQSDMDLFFKSLRIQIIYLGKQCYSRIKLRTLLKRYGYQKRSQKLMQYMKECIAYYHIQSYIRGGVECDIENIALDEMITFRIT